MLNLDLNKKVLICSVPRSIAIAIEAWLLPTITIAMFGRGEISSSMLSGERIAVCLVSVLCCMVWNRAAQMIMRHYCLIEVVQTLIETIMFVWFIINWNSKSFFIINVIICEIVVNVLFGQSFTTIGQIVFNGESGNEMIRANTTMMFFSRVGTLLGGILGLCVPLNCQIALGLAIVADIVRTSANIYVYRRYYLPKSHMMTLGKR